MKTLKTLHTDTGFSLKYNLLVSGYAAMKRVDSIALLAGKRTPVFVF